MLAGLRFPFRVFLSRAFSDWPATIRISVLRVGRLFNRRAVHFSLAGHQLKSELFLFAIVLFWPFSYLSIVTITT